VGPDPCTSFPSYTLGQTVQDSITALDCNGAEDSYRFSTTAATTFFSATLTSTNGMLIWPLWSEVQVGGVGNPGVPATRYALAPPGTHQLRVNGTAGTPNVYTLTTAVSPSTVCPLIYSALGVSTSFALSGCPAFTPSGGLVGTFTAMQYFFSLTTNKQFRVTVQSSAFQARIELKAFGSNTTITSANAAAVGGSAVLVFTPSSGGAYAVFVTSQNSFGSGNYTITVDP
jgi:hypothetical protein